MRTRGIAEALVLALAVATLSGAARPPQPGRWLGPDGAPLPFDDDEAAMEFLRTARVIESEVIPGTQNDPLKLLLERGGVRAHAIFRDVDRVWRRSWVRGKFYVSLKDSAASERAAYLVAQMIGLDGVPPVIMREIDGRPGSLQLWIEQAPSYSDFLDGDPGRSLPDDFVSRLLDIRIFDNLVDNEDRHPGNILIDANGKVWMIDHTLAFQYDGFLPDRDNLETIDDAMWDRLREISDEELRATLAGLLDDGQLDALVERRRRLVEHFEKRIAERGATAVLR